MSFNDAWNLTLALLLVGVLALSGWLAFGATPAQRRDLASTTGQTLAVAGAAAGRVLASVSHRVGNLLLLAWVVGSWQRVTRNLGLAYADRHAIKRVRTTDSKGVLTEKEHPKITYPWFLPRVDAYGVVLTVWTRGAVGRREWESAAEYLANTWRCRRVRVEQRKPGRLTVRGLRRDPLSARLSLSIPEQEL